ncbi:xanthine dehydrogenase family protein molybdopterin-binding subunit [Geobacter argillaceus]|uniref:4-hydroxybenzoyl-CoA reductase alpha subunit n=1 Tax=Geobacter argillaceus TaxID=345631 RepID=A0A562V8F5_9BACT|nr:xanthine dehydrogenase family protein molybdopterin-binding subunit [Geobacter argillaceus]TWJ14185.1 4-hydroxybenzoyl-CoA reductase alpha subunit [Geobacter argillaceus]
MSDYAVLGKRLPRVDGPVKAAGTARFTDDLSLPGMLHGKILRSPHAHARILRIDTTRAEKHPGVRAVIVGEDFGDYRYGLKPDTRDEYPLARGKVRYLGEEVAAVAAIDEETALEALELIQVDYEVLPAVTDPEETLREGAPLIHDDKPGNISVHMKTSFGDVDEAFRQADYIREDRFYSQSVLHGFLEPNAALALWEAPNRITIWASKQSPYFLYRNLSNCFNVPLSNVRLIQPYIGGGFGGKNGGYPVDFCAVMLSKKSGRPVKIVLTMEEVLSSHRRRHPMIVWLKTGVKKDGTLLAHDCRIIADGGAGTGVGPSTIANAFYFLNLPYVVPNVRFDGIRAYTNRPISVAQRGNGIQQIRFAADVQLDMIAEDLGLDPVEIREKNGAYTGYKTTSGMHVKSCGLQETITDAVKAAEWETHYRPWREKKHEPLGRIATGVGIACNSFESGARLTGHNCCTAVIKVHEDGTVSLLTGSTDSGQGSETVLAMIVAEVLGTRLEDVFVPQTDSSVTPVDPGSFGSRVSSTAGNAVLIAAKDAKQQLLKVAAELLKADPDTIEFRDRKVFVREAPERLLRFRDLARQTVAWGSGTTVIGQGSWGQSIPPLNFETGEGDAGGAYSFGTQAAWVEVDTRTGKVTVPRMVVAHDLGFALNPLAVEGQHEGSIAGGVGHTIYEHCVEENGQNLTPNLTAYGLPTVYDLPEEMVSLSIETIDPVGAFGAKESGEGTQVSTIPAIVNAIHNAIGVWITDLPVTPEKVLKALGDKKAQAKATAEGQP